MEDWNRPTVAMSPSHREKEEKRQAEDRKKILNKPTTYNNRIPNNPPHNQYRSNNDFDIDWGLDPVVILGWLFLFMVIIGTAVSWVRSNYEEEVRYRYEETQSESANSSTYNYNGKEYKRTGRGLSR